MSIVFETSNGCLVDHGNCPHVAFSLTVEECGTLCTTLPIAVKHSQCCGKLCLKFSGKFFQINGPFVMDTMFAKTSESASGVNSQVSFKKERRKRKRCISTNNDHLALYHEKIKCFMQKTISEVLDIGQQKGLFCLKQLQADNNIVARKLASLLQEHSICLHRLNRPSTLFQDPLLLHSLPNCGIRIWPPDDIVNRLVFHHSDKPCILRLGSESNCYLIPPNCSFLMSDIRFLNKLAATGKQYDLVVVDPPWPNKSVKRKKGYDMLEHKDILNMPVYKFMKNGTLVAVWSTHNSNCMDFIREELFPKWGITFTAEWHWLKITTRGKTVYDLESYHKKPYEHLLIGQKLDDSVPVLRLPDHKVFCSVPSSLHSHKPPLTDLFKSYFQNDLLCLELFARNLLPGWTSWGNEVLLFQHLDFYEPCEEIR